MAEQAAERFQALVLVALEDLVAGLARDPELTAHLAHAFPVQKASDETKTFLHRRTLFPRHQHLRQKAKSVTHVSGTNRHLCLGSRSPLHLALSHLGFFEDGQESWRAEQDSNPRPPDS
jgi:hypothetical protein